MFFYVHSCKYLMHNDFLTIDVLKGNDNFVFICSAFLSPKMSVSGTNDYSIMAMSCPSMLSQAYKVIKKVRLFFKLWKGLSKAF